MKFENLSIVVPTLNSRHLIEPVAEKMRDVFSQAGEVIVVDSFSEDKTLELLREVLDFDGVTFHSRPRGLYESWNFGICKSTKKWLYMATAGDIIELEELEYLYSVAESSKVDVVVAPPRFFNESGEQVDDQLWPILELMDRYEDVATLELSGDKLVSHALTHCRPGQFNGWLGSSASNIYRAEILRQHPFPTNVGPIGDSLWGLQYAPIVQACFCRRRCGRFVIHEAAKPFIPNQEISAMFARVWADSAELLMERTGLGSSETELGNFLHSLFKRELASGEKARRLRARIRHLTEKIELYSEYVHESRQRIPRVLKRLLLPSLTRKGGCLDYRSKILRDRESPVDPDSESST